MEKILLCISYIGTGYHGWQVQKNAVTVQQKMQDAIERILGKRYDLTGCSRTDAGVHANEYYCAFSSEKNIDIYALPKALNAVLPFDIAIKDAEKVPMDFHPRYSAKAKEYVYIIHNSHLRDPFCYKRAMRVVEELDVEKMKKAIPYFLGYHDFSAFCASGGSVTDKTRNIKTLAISKNSDKITISVSADGFLYNMVRIIAGTLIEVGKGNIAAESIGEIIESRDRKKAGPTAKPDGLYLNKVYY